MAEEEHGKAWQRVTRFLRTEVWEKEVSSMSAVRGSLIRALRVAQLVVRGFKEDDLTVHASALTFVTLMSLVPMLAVAFALLKGFGFGQERLHAVLAWTSEMPAEFQTFVNQVLGVVSTTNFAALGWIGMIFVVFMAVMVLGSAEASFNRIWGVTTRRALLRQAANYISILVLVPLLIGVAGSAEAWMKARAVLLPESVGFVANNLLRLASVFTTWLAFWFLYTFLPNTRVRFTPALISSFFGALLWVAWQKTYISLQIGVARYNAIYGTFASVPIFLAWLYTSWVIILLGVELAFALQNSSTFQMESAAENASAKTRFILSLSIVLHAAQAMTGARPRFEAGAYAREHRVPIRLLNDVVGLLVRAGILAETAERQGCFVLVKSADALKVKDLLAVVAQEGARPEALGLATLEEPIDRVMRAVEQGLGGSLHDLSIKDLLERGSEGAAV